VIARAAGNPVAGIPLPGLSFPRPRAQRTRRSGARPIQATTPPLLVEVRLAGAPIVGCDVSRRVALLDRRAPARSHGVRWRGLALALVFGLALGGGFGLLGRHYLNQLVVVAPLPGVAHVRPLPIVAATSVDPAPAASPTPPPAHLLLQVPYTTQAPLGNWAQHQESCEEATLSMLAAYWEGDPSVVIDPHAADSTIAALVSWQVQHWGSEDDLTDTRLGELAKQYYGYGYRIVPNDPQVVREQLAAGRPLIAGVRTHGLGNSNYPGYNNHYEQQGWSVPHFVLVIGYDSDGVWLNDPGITKGRGYHVSWAQLTHAIDDLNQNYPALSQGQVLLVVGPEVNPTPVKRGSMTA
jgi:hypothetical protein